MTFDFDFNKHEGLGNIIHGKGLYLSIMTLIFIIFLSVGLIFIPWKSDLPEILFRTFLFICLVIIVLHFRKAVIKVSIDGGNLFIKIWKKEHVYPISELKNIKMTYRPTEGIVIIKLKRKQGSKSYVLYAASFQRERYEQFLKMKEYVEENINQKLSGQQSSAG
jgi:hypothetical protein